MLFTYICVGLSSLYRIHWPLLQVVKSFEVIVLTSRTGGVLSRKARK
jgi:hypothetical protein